MIVALPGHFSYLVFLLQNKLDATWKWLEGHSTLKGNNKADKLAETGVSESSFF